eukprot:7405281-Ditylum_brightwellii.AAC.1
MEYYPEFEPNERGNQEKPVETVEDDDYVEGGGILKEDIELLRSQVLSDVETISRWIYSVHTNTKNNSKWRKAFKRSDKFEDENPGEDENTLESPVSYKSFPPFVAKINLRVEASFRSLDECLLKALNLSIANDMDGNKLVQAIVDRVAQVPSLMKTVLLIDNKVDRKHILSYKIVRRVMFSPFSVMPENDLPKHGVTAVEEKVEPKEGTAKVSLDVSNSKVLAKSFISAMSGEFSRTTRRSTKTSWLVYMLKAGYGPMKGIVVDYLELLSNLTVVDYILDEDASPTPADIELYKLSKEEIFSKVESLKYLITAM